MPESDFRPGSEEEWDALLRQWRQRPPAAPGPFFYQRVRARVLAPAAGNRLPAWLWRPAYAAILGALVLAVSGDGTVAAPAGSRAPGPYPVRPLPQ